MKKIPTLFKRVFNPYNHQILQTLPEVMPGLEWVIAGEGIATIKYDGACCAIINNRFYKRYDANIKRGRVVPPDAIPCQNAPDPVTGHMPCWVPCYRDDPSDRWFWAAYDNYRMEREDGTYEAVGPHFQGNPYNLMNDILIRHGKNEIIVPRNYQGIKRYLETHIMEGIVFWKDGEPQCKIKRSDFGFAWGKHIMENGELTF